MVWLNVNIPEVVMVIAIIMMPIDVWEIKANIPPIKNASKYESFI